jgi:hypothetical protein
MSAVRTLVSTAMTWLHAIVVWLAEGAAYWAFAVLAAFVAVIVFRYGSSEPLVRYTGLGLQCLGMVLVINGIRRTRRLFGHAPVWQSLVSYIKRVPRLGGRDLRAMVGHADLTFNTHGKIHLWKDAREGASIEEKWEALESNVRNLVERAEQVEKVLDAEARARRDADSQERSAREAEDRAIRSLIEAQEVGGLQEATVGALSLLFGIILASLSHEIACLVP